MGKSKTAKPIHNYINQFRPQITKKEKKEEEDDDEGKELTYLSFLQRLSIRRTTNLNKQSSRAKGRTFQEITPTNEFLQLATWLNFETFYTETSTYFKTLWHGRKSQFFCFFIGRMLINQNLVILRKKVFLEKG